jgi:hypothetical protein
LEQPSDAPASSQRSDRELALDVVVSIPAHPLEGISVLRKP